MLFFTLLEEGVPNEIIRKQFKRNKNKCFFASCIIKFWISLAQDVGRPKVSEKKGIRKKT